MRTCTIDGCDKRYLAKGYCNTHYQRIRKTGHTDRLETLEQRFWAKVEKTETCWNWTAGKSGDGYGTFTIGPHDHRAHRVSFRLAGFELVDGMVLDHLCRNRVCVNPDHLEQVTQKENMARAHMVGPVGQTWVCAPTGADGLSVCGSAGAYRRGCRCAECKTWQAGRVKEYRNRKKLAAA